MSGTPRKITALLRTQRGRCLPPPLGYKPVFHYQMCCVFCVRVVSYTTAGVAHVPCISGSGVCVCVYLFILVWQTHTAASPADSS